MRATALPGFTSLPSPTESIQTAPTSSISSDDECDTCDFSFAENPPPICVLDPSVNSSLDWIIDVFSRVHARPATTRSTTSCGAMHCIRPGIISTTIFNHISAHYDTRDSPCS